MKITSWHLVVVVVIAVLASQSVASRVRPRDCYEIYSSGVRSDGVYTIFIGCSQRPAQVYCDMTSDGGGWTVFQRRMDGSVDFYRNWYDYRNGFGNLHGEFWLGNDNLHLLTSDRRYRLRIDLADFEGNSRYAEYDNFQVDSFRQKFKLLSLGTYSGIPDNDAMAKHLGMKFSTRDEDNDEWGRSCAVSYRGAWWYRGCHDSNLNGAYLRGYHGSHADGVEWKQWTGHNYSLRRTEMKIKPFDV